ncbi:MAG: DUF5615 family PIN-like protein [Betaproteobacteria bacterium]
MFGNIRAPDSEVMAWALANGYVLFTHDLDFEALLAAGGDSAPSVIQLRSNDVTPEASGELVLSAMTRFVNELESGALISIDTLRARVRLLPLN